MKPLLYITNVGVFTYLLFRIDYIENNLLKIDINIILYIISIQTCRHLFQKKRLLDY